MYTEPQIFANLIALQGYEKNHNQDGKNQFPGSNNKTDEDFKLLTINTRQAYQRRLDEQV